MSCNKYNVITHSLDSRTVQSEVQYSIIQSVYKLVDLLIGTLMYLGDFVVYVGRMSRTFVQVHYVHLSDGPCAELRS